MSNARPPLSVAVLQSCYLPWKGYFDIIHDVDLFVFYDDVQFTKHDWRNRNRVPTAQGLVWLTVPVGTNIDRLICDVSICSHGWQKKHLHTLQQAYARSPHLTDYSDFLQAALEAKQWTSLSDLNQSLIRQIAARLGITTRFDDSRRYALSGQKQGRLLDLLTTLGATRYLSGPSGRDYLQENAFHEAGIALDYKDYSGYPPYRQLHDGSFEHGVSVVDLLCNTGPSAPWHIWGWRTTPPSEFS